MKEEDKIAEALGIETYSKEIEIIPPKPLETTESKADISADALEDLNLARSTIRNIIQTANTAIDELAGIAISSEKPAHYEVLTMMIKATTEAARDLYGLHKTTRDLTGKKLQNPSAVSVDKAVFVGTTDDLLKQVNVDKERK